MVGIYALEIKKADLPLLKLLNDGFNPELLKREHYLVFEIEENGKEITTTIMSKREMLALYDIPARNPFLTRLVEIKS